MLLNIINFHTPGWSSFLHSLIPSNCVLTYKKKFSCFPRNNVASVLLSEKVFIYNITLGKSIAKFCENLSRVHTDNNCECDKRISFSRFPNALMDQFLSMCGSTMSATCVLSF